MPGVAIRSGSRSLAAAGPSGIPARLDGVDGLGQEGHDHHRQQQDEEQGPGELGDDDRDKRILARAAEFRAEPSPRRDRRMAIPLLLSG